MESSVFVLMVLRYRIQFKMISNSRTVTSLKYVSFFLLFFFYVCVCVCVCVSVCVWVSLCVFMCVCAACVVMYTAIAIFIFLVPFGLPAHIVTIIFPT